MILSKEQMKEIADIISRHTGVLLHVMTGETQEDKVDKGLLSKLGLSSDAFSLIHNSFVLGKLVQMLSEDAVKTMTYTQLKEEAKKAALSKVEKNSLEFAKRHAAQYVTSLGRKVQNKVETDTLRYTRDHSLAEAQRAHIRDKVQESIFEQQTRQKLASELYHSTEDYTRDWKRVAHTELWNARLNGEVASILAGDTIHGAAKSGDTLVFRRPAHDSCNHCKRLYLENDGVTPKVFKMSELLSNGDNHGRKSAEWVPTATSTHPNCTCPIAVLPDGFGFDSYGNIEFQG